SLPVRGTLPATEVKLLAPVDEQEVWAAGVTYKRSKVAREEESAGTGGSRFYDMVYTAPRPEPFFTSPARRVVHPAAPVRILPDGVLLLTGTGIVPPDDFTLAVEDVVAIEVAGIGRLVNRVG